MSTTSIEWTEKTWRAAKTAARRLGLTLEIYVSLVDDGLKYCWRCRAWRSRNLFGVDRSRGDGLSACCIECRRPPRQLNLVLSTQADRDRLRYATDPAYRAERRQHAHARARDLDPLPVEGAKHLLEWTGGLCLYCDAAAATWDHIVPVSQGGRTEPGNMAPACVSCNSRKKDSNVYDFIDRYQVPVTSRLDEFLALALEKGVLNEHLHVD